MIIRFYFAFIVNISNNRNIYNMEPCFPLSMSNKHRYFGVPVIAFQYSSKEILLVWRYAFALNDIKNTPTDLTLLCHVITTRFMIG